MRPLRKLACICLVFALPAAPAIARMAESGVLIGVAFLDTSTEGDYGGVRADETARLKLVEARLGEAFAGQGIRMIDRAPVQEKLDRVRNVAHCNGCDTKAAETLGADLAVTAEVQKVSNLILTINVFVREAGTGRVLRAGNADIRGNTDESWLRGVNWILENRIFAAGPIEVE